MRPFRAAISSGVDPRWGCITNCSNGSPSPRLTGSRCVAERAWTSAPCASSTRTASGFSWAAAHISAVCPWDFSAALTLLAPCSKSASRAAALPVPAHDMSAVSPISVVAFGSAPAPRSCLTTAALRLVQASVRGVTP